MNNFIYNNKPYSKELQSYFYFLPSDIEASRKLSEILFSKKGVYILYGFRGTGKTSIVNYAIDDLKNIYYHFDKEILNIRINSFKNEKDFYRQLMVSLVSELVNILDDYEDLIVAKDEDLKGLDLSYTILDEAGNWNYGSEIPMKFVDIMEKINNSIKNSSWSSSRLVTSFFDSFYNIIRIILDLMYTLDTYDWDIKKVYEDKDNNYSKKGGSLQAGVEKGISLLKLFVSGKFECEKSSTKSKEHIESRTLNTTYENKKENILNIVKDLNRYFKVNIIIDEVDKIKKNDVVDFLDKNKSLYYDSDSTLLLVTDIGTKLFIENNCDYTFDTSYILLKSFTFIDFLVMGKHLGYAFNDFISSLEKYFASGLNKRQSIYNYDISYRTDYKYPGIALFKFLNSEFFNDLSEVYKEIFAKFYFEILIFILKVKTLSEEDYDKFVAQFINRYELDYLIVNIYFERFKELVKEGKLNYSFNNLAYNDYGYSGKRSNEYVVEFFETFEELDAKYEGDYYLTWEDNKFLIKSNSNGDIQFEMFKILDKKSKDIIDDIVLYYCKEDVTYNPNRIKVDFYMVESFDEFNFIIKKYFFRVAYVLLFIKDMKDEYPLLNGAVIIFNKNYDKFEVYYSLGDPGLNSHKMKDSQEKLDEIINNYGLISNTKKSSAHGKKIIEYENVCWSSNKLYNFFENVGGYSKYDKEQFIKRIMNSYDAKNRKK